MQRHGVGCDICLVDLAHHFCHRWIDTQIAKKPRSITPAAHHIFDALAADRMLF